MLGTKENLEYDKLDDTRQKNPYLCVSCQKIQCIILLCPILIKYTWIYMNIHV